MNGFLNILKPPGMTSAAVVAVTRRLTGEKRVGHAGTLDPEAAGVLPVMIGKAARLFDYLVDKEKEYVAECAFGQATDTQDATGRVTAAGDCYPTLAQVRAAADRLTGDIWQRPSMYSAIKQDGVAMYERARRGETVDVQMAMMAREDTDGTIKVALRAIEPTRVDGVAFSLGGGGHAQASGCTVDGPLDAAIERVLSAMKKALNEERT